MADLSVAGRIYRNGKLAPGILHIDTRTGLIEKVARTATLPEHLDFGDKAILPGAIDIHVHLRDPGMTHKEDWHSGTVSAAYGGVTGVVDMPNTLPPATSLRSLQEKLHIAADKAVVDYAAYAGTTWFTGDLPQMLRWSPGVKIYLGASTGDLLVDDQDKVKEVLEITAAADRPVILHAEAERVLDQFRTTEEGLADHDRFRPPTAEVEAIYDVIKMLPLLRKKPRIHIAHAASVDALAVAESGGFSIGVCPHHLLLDTDQLQERPAHGKMNPPLRGPGSRARMWEAFAQGKVAILESDHAPHTKTEKDGPFHKAPAGVPGVETLVPVMLGAIAQSDIPLGHVVDAVTRAPAALLGLDDRGRLEKGMRADFAVYDLDAVTAVDEAALHSKCGWSPYHGMPAVFPSDTFLAGRPVVRHGEMVAAAGSGHSMLPLPEES